MELIKDKAKQYGLTLNIFKCELIAENPKKFSDIEDFKDFRLIRLEDMTLLGAPVIGSQAMEAALKEKIRLLENAISRLQELNSHDGLTILRNSLGITKMQYILRTFNCAERPELTELDEKLRSGLVDILNVEFTVSGLRHP